MKAYGVEGSLGTLMQVEQDDTEEHEHDTEELRDNEQGRGWPLEGGTKGPQERGPTCAGVRRSDKEGSRHWQNNL